MLKVQFPQTTVLAVTATATTRVQGDICKTLSLGRNALKWRASFDRPNIFYEVRWKDELHVEVEEDAVEFIKDKYATDCGVIYCFKRERTESVAAALNAAGIPAAAYHAKLSDGARERCAADWASGKVRVVAATIAFGMGIDKADVRFVIHVDTPKTLEGFYQESGRAGRDGLPAHSLLYYSPGDIETYLFFLRQDAAKRAEQHGGGPETEAFEAKVEPLKKMREYCEPRGGANDKRPCRRCILLAHFGGTAPCVKGCDLCSRPESQPSRAGAQKRRERHFRVGGERELTPHQQFVAQRSFERHGQRLVSQSSETTDGFQDQSLSADPPVRFDAATTDEQKWAALESAEASAAGGGGGGGGGVQSRLAAGMRSNLGGQGARRSVLQGPVVQGSFGGFQKASSLRRSRPQSSSAGKGLKRRRT
jgi:superfamily II DNA helicase RecQ